MYLLLLGNQALRQLYEDKSYGVNDFMNVVLHVHGKYRDMVVSLFASHKDFLAALDRVRCHIFQIMHCTLFY